MAYENEYENELELEVDEGESERAARVYRDIDAYVNKGGRDLEEDHLALAQSDEEKEKIRNLWHKGRKARLALVGARFDALRPKIEEAKRELAQAIPKSVEPSAKPARAYRRYAKSDHVVGASFFVPPRQPKAEEAQKDNAPRKAIVAKFVQDNRDDLAARKPEEEPEELPGIEPEEEAAPDDEAVKGEIVTSTQIALPITSTAAKAVALLNQKHHVIGNYGNKCVILSWELWEINRNVMIPTFQRFEGFKHRYMNRYVSRQTDEGSTKVPAGKFWLNHPDRKTYDSVTFRPKEPIVLPGNRLNLWRGFGVFPREGSWKLMHEHIYDVLGAGDPQAGLYIERWLAYTVQHPDVVGETVLVLQGDEGTGKGTLARAMLKIFGPHGLPISQPKHLIGGFSGHLHHCCFLFLDEAFWAGDVQAEGRLKSLITEDTVTIEPKYFAPFQVPNLLHILMSSNNDWVVPAGPHARRYAVFKVSDKRLEDFAYFSALRSELDNGGVEAMLYDLLRLDLGDWRPRQIYKTAALTEQKAHSLRGLPAWIEQMLQEGSLPYGGYGGYPNRSLTEDLTEHAKQFEKYTNKSLVPRELKKLFGVTNFGSGTARGWKFPPLPECRKLFEARFGPWDWHYDIEEWQRRN